MTRPSGRSIHRRSSYSARRGSRPGRWRRRPVLLSILAALGLLACLMLWAVAARHFARMANTGRQSFDAIVVLGTPADSDGNPSPEMLERVTEGVREYERGVAPRLIVTGTAAHNRFVEAEVMARVAQAQGVPAANILRETQALDTIQNACYSARILKGHGWRSAEIVSGTAHLPRAAMIFSALPFEHFQWRMHATPEQIGSWNSGAGASVVETIKTARYLIWARWVESCSV